MNIGMDKASGSDKTAITFWKLGYPLMPRLTGVFMNLEKVEIPEGCLAVMEEVRVSGFIGLSGNK